MKANNLQKLSKKYEEGSLSYLDYCHERAKIMDATIEGDSAKFYAESENYESAEETSFDENSSNGKAYLKYGALVMLIIGVGFFVKMILMPSFKDEMPTANPNIKAQSFSSHCDENIKYGYLNIEIQKTNLDKKNDPLNFLPYDYVKNKKLNEESPCDENIFGLPFNTRSAQDPVMKKKQKFFIPYKTL